MYIASYNVQTLSSEAKLEMEEEITYNVRIQISGQQFHFKGAEESSYGGVDFLIHKKHIANLKKIVIV